MRSQAEIRVTERIFSLFEPDALLPTQYFDTLSRRVPIQPEKRLMWAVLEDAVECYQKHFSGRKGKPNGELREVEDWILDDDSEWLFSFNNICETLGIHPHYLRRGLLNWKERQVVCPLEANDDPAIPPQQRKLPSRSESRPLRLFSGPLRSPTARPRPERRLSKDRFSR